MKKTLSALALLWSISESTASLGSSDSKFPNESMYNWFPCVKERVVYGFANSSTDLYCNEVIDAHYLVYLSWRTEVINLKLCLEKSLILALKRREFYNCKTNTNSTISDAKKSKMLSRIDSEYKSESKPIIYTVQTLNKLIKEVLDDCTIVFIKEGSFSLYRDEGCDN